MSSIGGIGGVGGGGGNLGAIEQIMAMRQQIIDRSQLLQQVREPGPVAGAEAGSAASGSSGPAGGFANALKSALDQVNATTTTADTLTQGYETGDVVDVAKVMLARSQAGVAFEATLQVRNKLLSAYQDIMKMGV